MKTKTKIDIFLIFLIILGFIYVGTRDFYVVEKEDNKKFDKEYSNVSKDNVFTYVNSNEVYITIKNGSAIIFMGFPNNNWTGYYAKLVNDAAKEVGVKKILYYDFLEDRNNNNGTYESIVNKLSSFLPVIDTGEQNIYAPTLVIVKNGQIVAFDNETAIKNGNISPDDYWNQYNSGIKIQNLKEMFKNYLEKE